MKADLNGIQMNGPADADGSIWMLTGMAGWDSAAQSYASLSFSGKDGVTLTRGTYQSRAVSLSGVCKATNEANLWKSYYRLMSSVGPKALVDLAVTEGAVTKFLRVRRAAEIRADVKYGHFTFEVPLVAPFPVKYGVPQTASLAAGGSVTVDNVGSEESYGIKVAVTSAGTVILTCDSIRLSTGDRDAAVGTEFDFAARTVYRGSVNQYSLLIPRSEWWPLEPGSNTIQNTGTANVDVSYRPAWM